MESYRSAPHRRLERWLDEMGLTYDSEVDVLNYTMDIYMPEYHLAIEVDGPYHGVKREQARDWQIYNASGIVTIRLKGFQVEHRATIIRAIERWAATAQRRQSGGHHDKVIREQYNARDDI